MGNIRAPFLPRSVRTETEVHSTNHRAGSAVGSV